MFFKIGALNIFAKLHWKTSVLQSLFSKIAGLGTATLLKETPTQVFSGEICKTFKNNFFYRTSPVATSEPLSFLMLNWSFT